ncbi:MAG: hypothetical protein PHU06_08515 [Gallionella sp.]|nr:hypothetical protein [Gallionella sp.]MDD4959052.1 hypothetical protein [Gallionella sp.]
MLTLPLEPMDDRANPAFKNVAECTKWLNQLQLTNLQLAHSQLLIQINELNHFPIRALERLSVLELLRETVAHVQADYAKKLIARPLLLSDPEYMVFVSIVHLWQAMVTGYQRCLQDYLSGDKQIKKQGSLLCHRCLLYSGLEIFEYLRTGYEFNPNLWYQLHNLYAFAEQEQLHETEVKDELNAGQVRTNCCNIYVKTLLACDAHPAELTRSQLRLLDGWLNTWSKEIRLARHFTVSKGDAQPLAVDLESTQGLQWARQVKDNEYIRYLALVPLSKLLRVKIILLDQGTSSDKVGLGVQVHPDECVELLTFLHKCWCELHSAPPRILRAIPQEAQLCYAPDQIWAQLKGKPFAQPHQSIDAMTRQAAENFGNVSDKAPSVYRCATLEDWLLESDSLLDAQLIRRGAALGRLSYSQLVAVRASGANDFVLAATTWLKVSRTGKLQIGVSYFPGTPDPVYIRPAGLNQSAGNLYELAFSLPALPAMNIPASLILPRAWFEAGRVIEVRSRQSMQIAKLGISVARGLDYERVSFIPIKL